MRKATPQMIEAARPPAGFEPIVSSSPFGWKNGPFFDRISDGSWVRGFRVDTKHTNAVGMCHGGMLMTFADVLLSVAVLKAVSSPFVTVRLTSDFVGPARLGGWVEGAAEVLGVDDGLVSVVGRIYTGDMNVVTTSALFKQLRIK